jgi:hypothetical protein
VVPAVVLVLLLYLALTAFLGQLLLQEAVTEETLLLTPVVEAEVLVAVRQVQEQ